MEGGYDFKTTESTTPKEYVCLICQLLLKDPTELPCSHVYCNHCLIKWEDKKMKENEKSREAEKKQLQCLLCNEPYQKNQKQPSRAFDRMIRTSLDVLCKQHQLGCKWIGKIVDFQEHERVCEHVEVACRIKDCDVVIQRQHLMKHEEECPNRIVECRLCEELLKFSDVEEHITIYCPNFEIECPNSGCEYKTKRHMMEEHLEKDCSYQQINCEFHSIGCDAMLMRKDVEEHNTTFNNQHTQLLLLKYLATNDELVETKQELVKTKEELMATKQTMSVIKDELQTTKKKLEKSNNQLEESKKTMKTMNEKLTKSIKEKNEMKEKMEKLFQTCFHVIEKSTNTTVKGVILKPTFENLLPLLSKKNCYIEAIELNGHIYEFTEFNRMLKTPLTGKPSYKERFEIILQSMKIGQIYSVSDGECYFKLQTLIEGKLYVSNAKVKEKAIGYGCSFENDTFIVIPYPNKNELFYQIEGYVNTTSLMYIYSNNKEDEKLLIEYDKDNANDITHYRTKSNEILFQLVKK